MPWEEYCLVVTSKMVMCSIWMAGATRYQVKEQDDKGIAKIAE